MRDVARVRAEVHLARAGRDLHCLGPRVGHPDEHERLAHTFLVEAQAQVRGGGVGGVGDHGLVQLRRCARRGALGPVDAGEAHMARVLLSTGVPAGKLPGRAVVALRHD